MVVDSVELLRMIRDGEIKFNTKIKRTSGYLKDTYVYTGCNLREIKSDKEIGSEKLLNEKATYEIIEEIDIQAIEELEKILYVGNNAQNIKDVFNNIIDKQNEILKAVKQLDKKIK